jgi:hypothetical protein
MDPHGQDKVPLTDEKNTATKLVSAGFGTAHTISGDRLGYLSTSATPIRAK